MQKTYHAKTNQVRQKTYSFFYLIYKQTKPSHEVLYISEQESMNQTEDIEVNELKFKIEGLGDQLNENTKHIELLS